MRSLPYGVTLHAGDCRDVLAKMPDNSMDSCVTDPPYHLLSTVKRFANVPRTPSTMPKSKPHARMSRGFMGKSWDGGDIAYQPELWAEVLRVLKPGAHLVAFGSTRGYHRMACAIEDAGFEIRDSLMWIYGSGFPKSQNVAKFIDKELGAKGTYGKPRSAKHEGWIKLGRTRGSKESGWGRPWMNDAEAIDEAARQYIPGSPEAAEFDGWGTALKPAFEPIVLARKPLSEKNVAANVLKWGTGGLNVGACRVGLVEGEAPYSYPNGAGGSDPNHMWRGRGKGDGQIAQFGNVAGRWPANITHDGSEDVEAAFPSYNAGGGNGKRKGNGYGGGYGAVAPGNGLKDKGSAARFFYSSKAGRDDRGDSDHPTIKPISLKQWLAKLITPKGGRVLDPFAGSGTTGEACAREHFKAVLIEQDKGYCEHIRQRMMRYRPWHSGQRIMPRKRDAAEYGFAMVYEE